MAQFKAPLAPSVTVMVKESPKPVVEVVELNENESPHAMALCLTFGDLSQINKLVGLNIQTPQQLIDRVKMLSTISVSGTEITLAPALLHRLKSRAVRQDLGEYLRGEVTRLLRGAVGI